MAALTVQDVVESGLTPLDEAASGGGDTIANPSGDVFLEVNNQDVSPITVTVTTQATAGGFAIDDLAVAVTNGTRRMIGPFTRNLYNDAGGLVNVSYSAVTSVTVNAYRFVPQTGSAGVAPAT